jgi:hypothetical protein
MDEHEDTAPGIRSNGDEWLLTLGNSIFRGQRVGIEEHCDLRQGTIDALSREQVPQAIRAPGSWRCRALRRSGPRGSLSLLPGVPSPDCAPAAYCPAAPGRLDASWSRIVFSPVMSSP